MCACVCATNCTGAAAARARAIADARSTLINRFLIAYTSSLHTLHQDVVDLIPAKLSWSAFNDVADVRYLS